MGCAQSKKKRPRPGAKVGRVAEAFERGQVGGATAQQQKAEAERKRRMQHLRELNANKKHQAQKKAAEQQLAECFKDKPPTGGGPVR